MYSLFAMFGLGQYELIIVGVLILLLFVGVVLSAVVAIIVTAMRRNDGTNGVKDELEDGDEVRRRTK